MEQNLHADPRSLLMAPGISLWVGGWLASPRSGLGDRAVPHPGDHPAVPSMKPTETFPRWMAGRSAGGHHHLRVPCPT